VTPLRGAVNWDDPGKRSTAMGFFRVNNRQSVDREAANSANDHSNQCWRGRGILAKMLC